MRKRLKRRSILLDEVRRAYLADVVIARKALTKDPVSLNLDAALALYAPSECTFGVIHGAEQDNYGGHVEIIHHESKRVADLSKQMKELLALEQESRLKAARLEVQAYQDQSALKNQESKHLSERTQLCALVSTLKDRLSCMDETALEKSRRAISTLKHQLEQSETCVKDLSPLAADAVRSRQEASQNALLLAGKDNRITDLETKLACARRDLSNELERLNRFRETLTAERDTKQALLCKSRKLSSDLHDTEIRCDSTRASLDESRRLETELTQKLADLQVEYTEAIQREETEHEELRLQLEASRRQTQEFKEKCEDAQQTILRHEVTQSEALSKVRINIEQELITKHQVDVQLLKEDLARLDEKFCKCDAKLKLEQEKRAAIDTELRALRLEEQSQLPKSSDKKDENYGAKLDEIFLLVGIGLEGSAEQRNIQDDLEAVKGTFSELKATVKRLQEENSNLNAHLDQYKAKSNASLSSAKVSLALADKAGEVSDNRNTIQMETDLNTVNSDRGRLQTANKVISESLDAMRADFYRLASEEKSARCIRAVAQTDLSKEASEGIETGRTLSHRCGEAIAEILMLRQRTNALDKIMMQFEDISMHSRQNFAAQELQHPKQQPRRSSPASDAKPTNSDLSSIEDPEFRKDLISAISRVVDILGQASSLELARTPLENAFDPAVIELENTQTIASRLVSLSVELSSTAADNLAELSALRSLTLSLPKNFSYSETMEKMERLEEKVNEASEMSSEVGKKNGREEEMQRLKQRNASQQNFVIELQEEIATMKSLMFAADEVKRQYSELEEKYRLLENEFTEKAENEVNSRKAKERIELQLTLAQAEIASLANEKENLVAAVKRTEAGISKLELQLSHTQRAYEDMLQHERSRLETNKHIGTQNSPLLHDIHVQTSFKTPGMTLRQVNSFDHVPHRRRGFESVTPSVTDFI